MRIKSVIFSLRIDDKTQIAKLRKGSFVASGVAWNDGTSLIDAAELALGNGKSWRRAELERAGRYGWQHLQLALDFAYGEHTLISRAANTLGNTQPLDGAETGIRLVTART